MPEYPQHFYLKNAVPDSEGAYTVHRFNKRDNDATNAMRDALLSTGEWVDASQGEYTEYQEVSDTIAKVAKRDELSTEQKEAIRAIIRDEEVTYTPPEPTPDETEPEPAPEDNEGDNA